MAIAPGMQARQRRLLYGLNVGLSVLLAIGLTLFAIWASSRVGGRIDLSLRGANSLSPRTLTLLRGLPERVRVTAIYSTALKELDPFAEKRRNHVADLLALYETAGRGRIEAVVLDPRRDEAKVQELLKRLREKPAYLAEIQPYRDALAGFEELNQRIILLAQEEAADFEQLIKDDAALARANQSSQVVFGWTQLVKDAQRTGTSIERLQSADIPSFEQAATTLRDYLTDVQTWLGNVDAWSAATRSSAGLAPATIERLASARDRHAPVATAIAEVLSRAQNIPAGKIEKIYQDLARSQVVVVETADGAEVQPEDAVWPFRTDASAPPPADGDMREFAGEQAVSSAILKLTQKDRTAVIFVRAGGSPLLGPDLAQMQMNFMQPPPPGAFEQMNELLKRENFETLEWDVAASPTPPQPQNASRRVYVVLPPPLQRPNPMQGLPPPGLTPEQRALVTAAVEEAGLALFLASWAPAEEGGTYPFAEYLRTQWGVQVRSNLLVCQFRPMPDRQGRWMVNPRELGTLGPDKIRFTNHAVGAAIGSLPVAFLVTAPLEIAADDPAASQPAEDRPRVEVIAEAAASEDVWGVAEVFRLINDDIRTGRGAAPREADLRSPFPIVVAATRADGRRIVVSGSEQFAYDNTTQSLGFVQTSAGIVPYKRFPGNTDLFINMIHWLTGDANRIAVGPQRGDVPRLGRLREGSTATFWRVFMVGIWPALALLVGGGVWLLRRR